MTDRRLTPFSGRIAHGSLRGAVAAERFVDGEPARIAAALADLCPVPGGARDRQVLFGDPVLVIDRQGGHAFVQAGKDGYCGWLPAAAVGPDRAPTHRVRARATHLYPEPRVQAPETLALPFGARLTVTAMSGAWAETPGGFLPAAHLAAWGDWADDPVTAAETLLGTPYLWGGNSGAGIDCSGLVQAAFHAAGRAMPADSDQQARVGEAVEGDLHRGDLVFWKGHVALVAGPDTILHATAHGMTTLVEPLSAATARIAASGGGPVTARRRTAALPPLPGP